MTNKIKVKDQFNYAIAYNPRFYNKLILSSEPIRDPLPVLTVKLKGMNKNKANIIDVLTCLYDSGSNDSMIKRKYKIPYDHRMISNKVEYSTA